MQHAYIIRFAVLIAAFAVTMHCAAQQTRSMVFETTDAAGNLLVLALQEADFSDPDYDGILSFVGQFVDGDEGDFVVHFGVSASLLAGIATDCITSIDLGDAVLGVSTGLVWIGLSTEEIEVDGVSISTAVVSTDETASLAVTGDYSDVFALFGQGAIQSEIEVSLAQALAVIASGSAVTCVDDLPGFKNCVDTARTTCAPRCVQTVTYRNVIDINGNVSIECSFTCGPCS